MPKAYVNIEDVDGSVAVNFVFVGPFNPDSHAHQLCNIIKKHLDEICEAQAPMTKTEVLDDGVALVQPQRPWLVRP